MQSSICRALQSDTSFRLLALQPGLKGTPLVATLEQVSLDKHQRYEAISYTWGDSANDDTITVNDQSITITKHLYSFLQRLRHQKKARWLWVDAICISQTDLIEKGQQVSIISSIFEQAQQVVVWLGEHADDSEQLFRDGGFKLHHLEPYTRDWKRILTEQSIKRLPLTDLARQEAKDWAAIWKAFLARPYWSRTWIVQELTVARAVTLHCGEDCGGWRDMVEKPLDDVIFRFVRKVASGDDDDNHFDGKLLNMKALKMFRTMRRREGMFMQFLPSFTERWRPKGLIGFVRLLTLLRDTECQDPRDTIYACLSLTTQTIRDNISPDYTVDLPTLWIRVIFAKNEDIDEYYLPIISSVLIDLLPIGAEGLRKVVRTVLEFRGPDRKTVFLDEVLADIGRIARGLQGSDGGFHETRLLEECCGEAEIDLNSVKHGADSSRQVSYHDGLQHVLL